MAGCAEQESLPSAPSLAVVPAGCDLGDAVKAARSYFTDNGNNSLKSQAIATVRDMEGLCSQGDDIAYTASFPTVAGQIRQAIATGVSGDPSDGDDLIWLLINATSFDPCAGDPNCVPWDGFPNRPDFTNALSPAGAWAVLTTGTDAVCSAHRYPCSGVDPDPGQDGDTWGVDSPAGWDVSLYGRTSVLFGHPIGSTSPTGEALLGTALPAYEWGLIPQPTKFAADLVVGLCSIAQPALDEALIQKSSTVLEQAVLDFCPAQTAQATPPEGFFAEIGRFVVNLFDPRPRDLMATAFRVGPGGSAGSFTPFYAADLPAEATWMFLNDPADIVVGQDLQDANGVVLKVRAITTSRSSPLELAKAIVTLRNNNGLIPSGGAVTSTTLTCDSNGVCTGFTQADEDPEPGVIELPIQISKTGGYELCVTGELAPLQFTQAVCTPKFNVKPAN